jgi:transcriptional regulator with PAS, ATPase and Fis domain
MRELPISLSAGPLYEHVCAALDCVAEAVVTVDGNSEITSFNQAAERLTGWTRAEALGRPCREILRCSTHGDDGQCPLVPALLERGCAGQNELALHHRKNESVCVSRTAYALRARDGEMTGVIHTFRPLSAATNLSPLAASQRRVIEDVLQRCQWSRAAASAELGLSRTTLWRKMRKLGIDQTPGKA